MTDRLSPERRSALMSKVRSTDTLPELRVRRLAHALGYRFRLHRRSLPGCPDLVFPSRKKVIFVHGCFWHRHPGCKKTTSSKSRVTFWNEKFRRNVERDKAAQAELVRLGWKFLIIWQCETKDPEDLKHRLSVFLG